jgi:hypothetical protein
MGVCGPIQSEGGTNRLHRTAMGGVDPVFVTCPPFKKAKKG